MRQLFLITAIAAGVMTPSPRFVVAGSSGPGMAGSLAVPGTAGSLAGPGTAGVAPGSVGMVVDSGAVAAPGKVVFFDDFNTGQLDRTKWNVVITGFHVNNEQQAYVDSTNTLFEQDGSLVLQPQYAPGFVTRDGQHFDFISARINTMNKFDFKYGRAEARIRMDSGAGLWPAWWLLGYGDWPACGETDIMEFVGEHDWASAAVHGLHYSGETPFVNRWYFPSNDDITKWHTYAVDWTPESLVFSYDGHPMFRVTRAMAEHYGPWAFDQKQFLILNYALGGAYPEKINGIEQPYNGLPESTVDLIKAHKARMYVDWVKVTQH